MNHRLLRLGMLLSLAVSIAACRNSSAPARPPPAQTTSQRDAPEWMVRASARVADGSGAVDAVPVEDVAAANAFAVRLLRQAGKVHPDVALSPWSVRTVLGLVGIGAAGSTWQELKSVAGFDADPAVTAERLGAGTAALSGLDAMSGQSANGLFVGLDTTPLPAYVELATRRLRATVESLDFSKVDQARDHINAWGDAKTGHRVSEVLPAGAIKPITRLVAANALAMTARWQTPFVGDATKGRPFHGPGGDTRVVPMMFRKSTWAWKHADASDVVVLPYKGERLELVLVVPTAPDGLEAVEATLERDGMDRVVRDATPTELSLYLPAFAQESITELSDVLKALGVKQAFSMEADLSGIDGAHDLFLAAVHHRVIIDLDETGTRAAAATAAMMEIKGLDPYVPAVLVVDRPFLYFVRERPSGAVLFEGRVVHPVTKHAPVPNADDTVTSAPAHEGGLRFKPADGY